MPSNMLNRVKSSWKYTKQNFSNDNIHFLNRITNLAPNLALAYSQTSRIGHVAMKTLLDQFILKNLRYSNSVIIPVHF